MSTTTTTTRSANWRAYQIRAAATSRACDLRRCIAGDAAAGDQLAARALAAFEAFEANPAEDTLAARGAASQIWAQARADRAVRDWNQFLLTLALAQLALLAAIFLGR